MNVNKRSLKLCIPLTLLKSGDIHPQPDPTTKGRQPKYHCTACGKGVIASSKAVSCDICLKWTHIKCTKSISATLYQKWVQENIEFTFQCHICLMKNLPFNDSINIEDQVNNNTHKPEIQPSSCEEDLFKHFKSKGLHFIHCNARSLLPKLSEIKLLAIKIRVAIIALTETWLDSSITNSEMDIDNYCLVRSDRNRNGEVFFLYIRKYTCIAFSQRTELQNDKLEGIWVDILLPKTKPILIGNIYRPPKQSDFIGHLGEVKCSLELVQKMKHISLETSIFVY